MPAGNMPHAAGAAPYRPRLRRSFKLFPTGEPKPPIEPRPGLREQPPILRHRRPNFLAERDRRRRRRLRSARLPRHKRLPPPPRPFPPLSLAHNSPTGLRIPTTTKSERKPNAKHRTTGRPPAATATRPRPPQQRERPQWAGRSTGPPAAASRSIDRRRATAKPIPYAPPPAAGRLVRAYQARTSTRCAAAKTTPAAFPRTRRRPVSLAPRTPRRALPPRWVTCPSQHPTAPAAYLLQLAPSLDREYRPA